MATSAYGVMFIAIIALGVGFLGWVLPGDTKPESSSVVLSQFGPSSQTEAMANNQLYCVGIQSAPLTLRSNSPNLAIGGMYAMTALNLTTYISLTLVVSSTTIANTFTAGNCGTQVFAVSAGNTYFNSTGLVLPTSGFVGRGSSLTAGSIIYAGIQVKSNNKAAAPVSMRSGVANSAGQVIFLQEQA